MKIKRFFLTPGDMQGDWEKELNKKLRGSTHVETYTKSNPNFYNASNLIIFAFYPDDEPNGD